MEIIKFFFHLRKKEKQRERGSSNLYFSTLLGVLDFFMAGDQSIKIILLLNNKIADP